MQANWSNNSNSVLLHMQMMVTKTQINTEKSLKMMQNIEVNTIIIINIYSSNILHTNGQVFFFFFTSVI